MKYLTMSIKIMLASICNRASQYSTAVWKLTGSKRFVFLLDLVRLHFSFPFMLFGITLAAAQATTTTTITGKIDTNAMEYVTVVSDTLTERE